MLALRGPGGFALRHAASPSLAPRRAIAIMAASKRKRSSIEEPKANGNMAPPPTAPLSRRTSSRMSTAAATVNPDITPDIFDAPNALRASPDAPVNRAIIPNGLEHETRSESPLSDAPETVPVPTKPSGGRKKGGVEKVQQAASVVDAVVDAAVVNTNGVKKGRGRPKAVKQEDTEAAQAVVTQTSPIQKKSEDDAYDPEAIDGEEEAGEEEIQTALSRPPPVNSDYLPLPWKGRLGYACLNTYLRNSNPPVFSSRTCRIQSILEHRHPLRDPSQPEHATKNRPDKDQPADIERGRRYVEAICLANVRDIAKMIRWNDRYGIKFMRLSSEMFPFASHEEYGYKLAPFASEALAEAGKVIAELGHRVTTHPGQFTQLGSPRRPVIDNSFRDLEYHDEMLSLLRLPDQQNKDAVMILHMGGMFEGKPETLQRFRENYSKLSPSVKNRLVLENCDMGWSVHDLLPICEELNIPFVLDFHHHNIIFDSTQIREGTKDIIDLFPRIRATWERKGITQKMHYSEPTPAAITNRQRRKHNPRVATLPPCSPDMDLMIEAKDKEQAVFELMRTFKLPGYDTFNDVIPHVRNDDNKAALATIAKKNRKTKKTEDAEEADPELILDDEVGMGGPEGRVYWPPGMEEWLRPKKREVKKKTPAQLQKEAAEAYAAIQAAKKSGSAPDAENDERVDENPTPAAKKRNSTAKTPPSAAKVNGAKVNGTKVNGTASRGRPKKAVAKEASLSEESSDDLDVELDDEDVAPPPAKKRGSGPSARATGGRRSKKSVNYNEDDDLEMDVA